MGKIKEADPRCFRPAPAPWTRSHGVYIAGRAAIDGADQAAIEAEMKWGVGRLRLLVATELREKFDRQRYLFNTAIQHGDLETVRRESTRMTTAWQALDRAATAAGQTPLALEVWEIALEDGTVAAIVQNDQHAHAVVAEGRKVAIYTLDEIARLLSAYPGIAKIKSRFPGAEVTRISKSPSDPLDAIRDGGSLDDPLDDPLHDIG